MKSTGVWIVLFILLLIGVVYWYQGSISGSAPAATQDGVGLANPASVACTDQGGSLVIVTDKSSGGQLGYCHLPDNRVCEEWALYDSGKCTPPAQ